MKKLAWSVGIVILGAVISRPIPCLPLASDGNPSRHGWLSILYVLPSEQYVREQFERHRADYIRLASLLRWDKAAHYIDRDGNVDLDGIHERPVSEYRALMHGIDAQFATVREDGSIEFSLWGCGGTIMDDSFMGIRYVPKHPTKASPGDWTQTVVASLVSANLPQEDGWVATGLYVIPIEPEWFIFRFEYQE